jgi:uncharacterized repeat protein (TIGR01451 family)
MEISDMIDKKNRLPRYAINRRWPRLIGLAIILALTLQFIPLRVKVSLRALRPQLPQPVAEPLRFPFIWQFPQTPALMSGLGINLVQATGGLTITKMANTSVVDQGGLITYTLIISNNTLSNLNNVAVTDTVPLNTQCVSISDNWLSSPALCQDNGIAAWIDGVLTNTTSVKLVYTVRVAEPLTYPTIITNNDYGVLAGGFSDYGTTPITTAINSPAWQIQKTVIPNTTVQAGGLLTYTITVTNVGPMTTSGPYTIIDVIPDHTAVSDNPDGGNNNGTSISWVLNSSLAQDQQAQVQYSVRVDSPLTDSIAIHNQTYSVEGGGAVGPVFGSPVSVNVSAAPALSVVKRAGQSTVRPGGTITYTITYSNVGNAIANNVIMSDTIPFNTAYLDSTPFDNNNGRIFSWLVGALSPADGNRIITLTVQADSLLDNGLPLTNSVIIAGSAGSFDTDSEIVTVDARPDLVISKADSSGGEAVRAGELLTYTITYANIGGGTLDFVRITDTLPASVSVESVDPGATTQVGSDPPVFTRAGLSPGQSGTIILVTRLDPAPWPAAGFDFANTVEASVAANEVSAANNTDAIITTGQPDVPSAIVLEVPATAPVLANSPITATVTDQYGNPVLDGTAVNFAIDPPGSANPASVNTNNGLAVTNISATDPGTVMVTATSGLASTTQPVEFIVPTLNKLVTPGAVLAGETLTYTVIYQNNTPGPINNLRITDTMPVSVTGPLIIDAPGATVADGTLPTLIFAQTSLASGERLTITLVGKLKTSPWPSTPTNFANQVVATHDTSSTPELKTVIAEGRPNLAANMSLQAVPTTTLVGNEAVVTATITDQYGNPVLDGTSVTFAASAGSSVTPSGMTTNGVVTATVTASVAGTAVVTVQVGTVSDTVQITFEGGGQNIYLPLIVKN